MSAESGAGIRAPIPSTSGRDSPLLRVNRQTAEEVANPKDKAYRRYANGVERALASFESPQQEWADYISFLGRLLKALQARPIDVHSIPDSYTVAARLAQCLTPALPPGVHRKAIDVYTYIFETIGKSHLEKELHLWLPGLAPVLSFASLAVRPEFLRLLDASVLPLNSQSLRAPLKSIILCILPGLEDESSEDHDAWLHLMNKLRVASEAQAERSQADEKTSCGSYFWQSFFLATMTNPSRRQGALSYLVRELPRFGNAPSNHDEVESPSLSDAAEAALCPEPGLLIRCLAAGLSDAQVLVQRGFLDLLVTHVPLDSIVLQKRIPKPDLDLLILAATGVVARRDMGLNRRLWTWFLGPEIKDEQEVPSASNLKSPVTEGSRQAAYFAQHGLGALSRSMKARFESKSASAVERSRPYKLCLSLMDRWEVGGLLIPEVLIPAIQGAMDYNIVGEKEMVGEVLKSASNFFDGVESSLIWATFNQLIEEAYQLNGTEYRARIKKIALCTFVVSQFNIREEEMIIQHIPQSSLFMLAQMKRFYQVRDNYQVYTGMLSESVAILEKLLVLIPTRAYTGPLKASTLSKNKEVGAKSSTEEMITRIQRFYREQHEGANETSAPFSPVEVGVLIVRQASSLLLDLFAATPQSGSVDTLSRIVCGLSLTVPRASLALHQINILESFKLALSSSSGPQEELIPFKVLSSVTSMIFTLQTSTSPLPNEDGQTESLEILLISQLWNYLDPQNPKHHVESVRCIWQIESIDTSRKLVEAVVTTLLSKDMSLRRDKGRAAPTTGARRFAVLWSHSIQDRPPPNEKSSKGVLRKPSNSFASMIQFSIPTDASNVLTRPLFLLLDCLQDESTELSLFVRQWLQDLPSLTRVFTTVTDQIKSLHCMRISQPNELAASCQSDDIQECLYFFRILLELVRSSSEQEWLLLAGDYVESLDHGASAESSITIQILVAQLALRALEIPIKGLDLESQCAQAVHRTALELMTQILTGPYPRALIDLAIHEALLHRLHDNIQSMSPLQQAIILKTIAAALKLNFALPLNSTLTSAHTQKPSKDMLSQSGSKTSLHRDVSKERSEYRYPESPALLIECLKLGFEIESSRLVIDNWVEFLIQILPLFPESIFQHIIPLVECLCNQIAVVFGRMKLTLKSEQEKLGDVPEPTLIGLLNALEHIIANAHQSLLPQDGQVQNSKAPEQTQGFFGNMVQGVFAGETEKSGRSTVANSRLTVLLCFQDAVRTCFAIWSWGSTKEEKPDASSLASYTYTAMRMRNRARRLLEHLFAAETLECMETLAALWCRPAGPEFEPSSILGLLNVLSGSKPKHTIPAVFNAIYSRTNPVALEPSKMSSLTSELQDLDLVAFLVAYTRTLDDDAMDEIWGDCVAFLRDVLANPLPHSQILPPLLLFTALLAEKVDNTNFGEQRKMRRELGDLFLRILTATFTTRPMGFLQEPTSSSKKHAANGYKGKRSSDILATLASVIPQLKVILGENDRIQNAVNSITTNVTGPTLRAKGFPSNIDSNFLEVLQQLTKMPQAARLWKKDVADALNDTRFFSMPIGLVKSHWLAILYDFMHNDKDRLPEVLARLTAPTTAGLVFGVGATSARQDADRRAQLILRRIALLVLTSPEDNFAKNIGSILEKFSELSSATPSSSPSSATLADIYILLRALFLRTSPVHLAPLWPFVCTELQSSISSVLPGSSSSPDRYSNIAILQAAKLLDLLTTLDHDDFQLHAWLFITDSIDAIHRPTDGSVPPIALVDAVADGLGAEVASDVDDDAPDTRLIPQNIIVDNNERKLRRPILDGMLEGLEMDLADLRAMPKQDLASRVLKPFSEQLSLLCYEATYGLISPDLQYCEDQLLKDIFDDGLVISS